MNRRLLIALAAVSAAACVGLGIYALTLEPSLNVPAEASPSPSIQPSPLPSGTETPTAKPAPDDGAPASPDPSDDYVSPIDFAALVKANPDVVAWLEIPSLDISYPVMFKEGDNAYYIHHGASGGSAYAGELFIEDYNSTDFDDPVTVVYGHNMKDGAMFGRLQEHFSDPASRGGDFTIYLPAKERHYRVFAAVPYSNLHILHYFDFNYERDFDVFFDDVLSVRSLSAVFDDSVELKHGDRVVILSTCLGGNNKKRFLVMGVCTDGETKRQEKE